MRLHDNELYFGLHEDHHDKETKCISLFVFDSKYFQPQSCCDSSYDSIWCGPHAAQSLIEAVTCLRESLRDRGGELVVRSGDPSIWIPLIADQVGATEIWYSHEPGTHEQEVVQKLQQHFITTCGKVVKWKGVMGYTLYHPNDLPADGDTWNRLAHPKQKHKKHNTKQPQPHSSSTFSALHCNLEIEDVDVPQNRLQGMCHIMGDFRKAARAATNVRPLLLAPKQLHLPTITSQVEPGDIPTLEELMQPLEQYLQNTTKKLKLFGLDHSTIEHVLEAARTNRNQRHAQHILIHGERAARQQWTTFLKEGHAAKADRSLADVSNHNSSRLSVHLALGTLSPRSIYWAVQQQDDQEDCQWLARHLEMRDFFLYTALRSGPQLYQAEGLLPLLGKKKTKANKNSTAATSIPWKSPQDHSEAWKRWATGHTGLPLVDAGMHELMATGYCSNRVRQNVASVLTKDLVMDWRAGAEWFQFCLEDHCVGANYGNWCYFAGVGSDPKQRHFRTVSQHKKYDPKGDYSLKWLASLRTFVEENSSDKREAAFRPWDFGVPGFASPLVDPQTQYTWQDAEMLRETGTLLSHQLSS